MPTLTHLRLSLVRSVSPRIPDGGQGCLLPGSSWVPQRLCLTCGHAGCCGSSTLRYARVRAVAVGHPMARSSGPGENWC